MWSGAAASKSDPWLPPPNNTASAFPLAAEARTKSPAATSNSSIEGWLQNVPPPSSNAVPVLPAKPASSELNDTWGAMKQPDPWSSSKPQQQVPDPWNSKSSNENLDPWAPLAGLNAGNQASGVSLTASLLLIIFFIKRHFV